MTFIDFNNTYDDLMSCEIKNGKLFGKRTDYFDPIKIQNIIINEDGQCTNGMLIKSAPQLAFYKDGKVLNALSSEWEKGM